MFGRSPEGTKTETLSRVEKISRVKEILRGTEFEKTLDSLEANADDVEKEAQFQKALDNLLSLSEDQLKKLAEADKYSYQQSYAEGVVRADDKPNIMGQVYHGTKKEKVSQIATELLLDRENLNTQIKFWENFRPKSKE